MDVDESSGAAEAQTKSGASPGTKAAQASAPVAPKRSRIIDEDDDEEFLPTTVAAAPKAVISAAPKVEAKSSASVAVKREHESGKDSVASGASAVKAKVKSEAVEERGEEKKLKSAPSTASVKKSASSSSTSASATKNGTPAKIKKSATKKDDDYSESDYSDSESDEPARKKKVALDGSKVTVKSAAATKDTATTKKSASAAKGDDDKSAVKKAGAKTTSATKKSAAGAKTTKTTKMKAKKEDPGDEEDEIALPPSQATKAGAGGDEKFKWWEGEATKAMKKHPTWKWATLQHAGVIFPPPYEPHGVKMLYNGKPVKLSAEAEEVASFFAKQVDGPHYDKPQFRKNFFAEFLQVIKSTMDKGSCPIEKFGLCDFGPITKHLKDLSEAKKARSKEEKEAEKKAKLELKQKYGYAMVNGHREPIGNFTVEPPGLFLGRGDHPKAGMIKKRIMPEDVTLNLSRDAEVPPCPIPGHRWGSIVHNHEVGWVAGWFEDITGHNKYVQFAAGSSIKGSADRKKYEKARLLKTHIAAIRKDYTANLKSKDPVVQQRATAMWIIDRLALRVGNEKKEDEADTVGCCSLRVEHVKLIPPRTLEFDFLGKDSMRYNKEVEVPAEIFANMKSFQMGKRQSEDIFHLLSTSSLNDHLKSLMPGLTAKVFRTYNASITLQEQLRKFAEEFGAEPEDADATESSVRLFYNRANRQVAILCNHQKTVSKNHQQQLNKIDANIQETKDLIVTLKKHLKDLKAGKVPAKSNEKKRKRTERDEDAFSDDEEDGAPSQKGKKSMTREEKEADTEAKEIKLPATPESCLKRIEKAEAKIEKLEADKTDKGEGAQIQNSTSKINYMDPRITIAFCAKAGLPLSKVFPATLIDKFAWAIAEVEDDPDFVW